MEKNTILNFDELITVAKEYAIDNEIEHIVIFAKGIDNVLKLNKLLDGTDIDLFVTTFPQNQILYVENEDGEIDEVYPEILDESNKKIIRDNNIHLVASTLPLDPIITPGNNNNPYHIINQTLNLFGQGTDMMVQSALMVTDNGFIKPGTRVLSLISNRAAEIETANSRFLFHPEYGIKINKIIK